MTDRPSTTQSSSVEMAIDQVSQPPSASNVSASEFRAVYEAHFRYVWYSLRRLGVQERDIEDLCHDVFVAFYRSETFDRSRPVKPWLFGIAFRVASDYRRRASSRLELTATDREASDEKPGADEQIASAQARQLVQRALAGLELDRRAVFVMHDVDGHTMPQIAEALGAPLNTCYSRLRLAREQFTEAVRKLSKRGEGAER